MREASLWPVGEVPWLSPAAPDPLPAVNDGENPSLDDSSVVAMLTASALKQRSLKNVLATDSSRDEDGK